MTKIQANYILYISSKNPATLTQAELNFIARIGETTYRHQKDMFALTAQEQLQADIQNNRIDLEYLRLEASQSAPAAEQGGGSNFIEALNANAADFFPQENDAGRREEDDDENK